jgi:hypothetical protein
MSGLLYLFLIECAYFNEVKVHLRAEGIYNGCGKKILDCFWFFKRESAFLTHNLFSEIHNIFLQTSDGNVSSLIRRYGGLEWEKM